MNKSFRLVVLNNNLLKTSQQSFLTSGGRNICQSSLLNGLVIKTPEAKLCEFNRTQYLHRNDTLRSQRVFYRGKKKIDYTAGKPSKIVKPVFSPKEEVMLDEPVDDVYLIGNYEKKMLSLEDSLHQLKNFAELDFTNEESIVQLRINLRDLTGGPAKRRKSKKPTVMRFLSTTEVPFPFNEPNKVGVFTDQEYLETLALENGAHATGSLLLIRKVLNEQVKCDCYICTDGYSRIVSDHKELNQKLGHYLPGKNWGVVTEEGVADALKPLTVGIQFDNFYGDGKECVVKVGRIKQPVEELSENIHHILTKVREEVKSRNKKVRDDFIKQISISCHTEDIPISIEGLIGDKTSE